jgi:hypothetical protein
LFLLFLQIVVKRVDIEYSKLHLILMFVGCVLLRYYKFLRQRTSSVRQTYLPVI